MDRISSAGLAGRLSPSLQGINHVSTSDPDGCLTLPVHASWGKARLVSRNLVRIGRVKPERRFLEKVKCFPGREFLEAVWGSLPGSRMCVRPPRVCAPLRPAPLVGPRVGGRGGDGGQPVNIRVISGSGE